MRKVAYPRAPSPYLSYNFGNFTPGSYVRYGSSQLRNYTQTHVLAAAGGTANRHRDAPSKRLEPLSRPPLSFRHCTPHRVACVAWACRCRWRCPTRHAVCTLTPPRAHACLSAAAHLRHQCALLARLGIPLHAPVSAVMPASYHRSATALQRTGGGAEHQSRRRHMGILRETSRRL